MRLCAAHDRDYPANPARRRVCHCAPSDGFSGRATALTGVRRLHQIHANFHVFHSLRHRGNIVAATVSRGAGSRWGLVQDLRGAAARFDCYGRPSHRRVAVRLSARRAGLVLCAAAVFVEREAAETHDRRVRGWMGLLSRCLCAPACTTRKMHLLRAACVKICSIGAGRLMECIFILSSC